MNLEVGKDYITRNGRPVKIFLEPWTGIYNGEYLDGKQPASGRWKENGESWDTLFDKDADIIMENKAIIRQKKIDEFLKKYRFDFIPSSSIEIRDEKIKKLLQ